jgi:putative membrane protein
MNDALANDRTFLAWVRTSIALFGLGFVVSKIAYIVDTDAGPVSDTALYTGIGIALVLCGGATVVEGYRQHRKIAARIVAEGGDPALAATWPRTYAVAAATLSIVLSGLILATT